MENYISAHLNIGEVVIHRSNRTALALVKLWLVGILLFALSGALIVSFSVLRVLGTLLCVLLPIRLIVRTMQYFHAYMVITNQRVIVSRGIISKNILYMPLNKVQNVSIKIGFWGRVFGYGAIKICDAAGKNFMDKIHNPEYFQRILMTQIDKYEQEHAQKQAEQTINQLAKIINQQKASE